MNQKPKTKKGAASIYAVVFATLLVGIIAISFVRLILREATNTTDNELSQSSRDAALVGIEDAKRAINSVYDHSAIIMEDNCDFVQQALNNKADLTGEVLIQTITDENKSKTEQAYTCVKVSNAGSDYKGTLNSSNTVAVVPLKYEGNKPPRKVVFSWHSDQNQVSDYNVNNDTYKKLEDQQNTPPVVSFQFVQTDATFSPIDDFNPGSTNSSLLFLTPSRSGSNNIDVGTLQNSHNTTVKNTPSYVKCEPGGSYHCSVTVTLPNTKNGSATASNQFLVLSLPYGAPETSFMVEMKDDSDQTVTFDGVQYIVDSTGRANDLYTRIEVRLNTVDPNFPYPQFAVQSGDNLEKNFWVTMNCQKVDNGQATDCPSSGNL